MSASEERRCQCRPLLVAFLSLKKGCRILPCHVIYRNRFDATWKKKSRLYYKSLYWLLMIKYWNSSWNSKQFNSPVRVNCHLCSHSLKFMRAALSSLSTWNITSQRGPWPMKNVSHGVYRLQMVLVDLCIHPCLSLYRCHSTECGGVMVDKVKKRTRRVSYAACSAFPGRC